MGCFDTVMVPCPSCGERHGFQSKSGDCALEVYELDAVPVEVLYDVNRHSPYTCKCGTVFDVAVTFTATAKPRKRTTDGAAGGDER